MVNSFSSTVNSSSSENDYMKFHQDRSKKTMDSTESDSIESPPNYAVSEDEHGNLVKQSLYEKVIWPNRPRRGRYSLNEYKKNKRRLKIERQKRNKKNQKYSGKNQMHFDVHTSEATKDSNNVYIGVQAASSLSFILHPTEFRIFYMKPESINSFNQMPIKMPLMLGYMSSSGKIYNFRFKRYEYDLGTFWQVDLDHINGPKQPLFCSMSALIKHYKSYVINRSNDRLDVFPVD